jgi:hypothetical protein
MPQKISFASVKAPVTTIVSFEKQEHSLPLFEFDLMHPAAGATAIANQFIDELAR